MIIFSGLNLDALDEVNHKCLLHAVPIISNRKTVVHFIKIDSCDRHRFGCLAKVLSEEQFPPLFDINAVLSEYQKTKKKEDPRYEECRCKKKEEEKMPLSAKM